VFDFTQPAELAGRRSVTTVPTQALFLMNSKLLKARARDLAERIIAGGGDESSRLERLWLTAFSRPITAEEKSDSAAFLAALRSDFSTAGTPADEIEKRAWAELCHAVLASNEFLIVL
jgi:hypothetical protein